MKKVYNRKKINKKNKWFSKKSIFGYLIAVFLGFWFFSCCSAFCYTSSDIELSNSINSILQKEIKSQLKDYSFIKDFKISVSGIPYIGVATTSNPVIEIQSSTKNFQKNSPKRVIIKDNTGSIVKAFPINVQTQVYADVLVASDVINFNKELTSNNTEIKRCEISNNLDKVLVELKPELIAKRNFQKGSLILADNVKTKAMIQKDSIVDIIFLSSNGLKIKIQGKALKEGALGDTILVRSDQYNKVYNAKVSSTNEVTVRI